MILTSPKIFKICPTWVSMPMSPLTASKVMTVRVSHQRILLWRMLPRFWRNLGIPKFKLPTTALRCWRHFQRPPQLQPNGCKVRCPPWSFIWWGGFPSCVEEVCLHTGRFMYKLQSKIRYMEVWSKLIPWYTTIHYLPQNYIVVGVTWAYWHPIFVPFNRWLPVTDPGFIAKGGWQGQGHL